MKYAELTPLKELKTLSRKTAWAFDCETKDGLKGCKLYCWSLSTNEGGKNRNVEVYTGKTMKKFFKILVELSEKKERVVFVHNLQFDARFIIDYCIRNTIPYYPLFAGSSLLFLLLPSLKFKFIDSFQFLLESQESAEETYNVNLLYRKIDCTNIFNKSFNTWSEQEKQKVIDHNINDVLALREIMNKFRKLMYKVANVDMFQVNTLASLSLKSFRKTMTEKIINPYLGMNFNKEANRFEYKINYKKYKFAKQSYYGGRTECFNHNFVKEVDYIDKVSMFPAQMKYMEFPKGIPYWVYNHDDIEKSLDDKLSIIECKVFPNYLEKYPVLPQRIDGKTVFANTNAIGIWNSVEIKYALERGYHFEYYRALVFPEKFRPFIPFVNKFFKLKSENTGAIRKVAKIELNGGYGKFGQRIEQEQTIVDFYESEESCLIDYQHMIDNGIKCRMRYNKVYNKYSLKYVDIRESMKPFQIVHLASFTTSYARIDLLKGIHALTDNGITVYYCDTDSIVVEKNNILKLGKELGNWDIEESFSEFKAIAPKCYIARIKKNNQLLLKVKGIRKDKIKEILLKSENVEEILKCLTEKIVLTEQYLPIKSSLLRNQTVLSSCITKKQLSLIDSKRITNTDLSTEPITDK